MKNSAEDVLRGHRPTRMEIKCSNMQHETLSNDLVPWHVSLCLRYGSSRERFFLSRLEKIRKRSVVAEREREEEEEEEEEEMKGERGSRVREGARRRANEGRIAVNVIFISGPRRGQRGHQQTGDE